MHHDDKKVKDYTFNYEAAGKTFSHEHTSTNKQSLKVGSKVRLFYLPKQPNLSFTPSFYGL